MTTRPQSGPSGRQAMLAKLAGPWWLFLVTGIAWLIISAVVLRFSIASVAAVGVRHRVRKRVAVQRWLRTF
jgi:uncharacterized membrane protein HdeD (DUF308 family)